MNVRRGSIALVIAIACAAFLATGCNKSSSNPVAAGGGGGGTFSDLVGFWFTASDTSGLEIRSDSTGWPLTVDNTGKLVYSADTASFKMKIKKAEGGQISGTVRVIVAGFVDTALAFSGTYALNSNKDTLHITLTGPFGNGGQITTISEVAVRSSLNAQVLSGGGGGGGGNTTPGSMSFNSDRGSFSANGVYNSTVPNGSGAVAYRDSVQGIQLLVVIAYRYTTLTSLDIAIVDFAIHPGSEVGTYSVAQGQVTIRYMVGVDPRTQNPYDNYYGATTGTAAISSFSSSGAQGTFSGSGVFYTNQTPGSQTFSLTNGTFSVPLGSPGAYSGSASAVVRFLDKLHAEGRLR